MKIKKIELQDFRQFYGQASLSFSLDPVRNVTLIHAENTVGKTTLLNAVLWAFFEMTTKKFENAQDIVCHEAANEGRSSAKVTVDFTDEGADYTLTRILTKSLKDQITKLHVHRVVDGDLQHLSAGQTLVNSIIPRPMAKYFFFDGEAAETFSAEGNRQEVRRAVRDILGCSFVDTAKNDLKDVKKQLNNQIRNETEDKELENIERDIERLTRDTEQRETLIAGYLDQVDKVTTQISQIDQFLKDSKAAALLQKERNDFELARAQALQNLNIAKSRVVDWLGDEGLQLVSAELARSVSEFLQKEDVRGLIPSPYNEEFVKSILGDKICICGRPLTQGSDEYAKVIEMLKTAAGAETRSRVQKIRAIASQTIRNTKKAPERLANAVGDRERLRKQISDIESKLGEISTAIGQIDLEEISKKEDTRRKIFRELQNLNQEIAKQKLKNEQDFIELRRLESLQTKALSQNARLRPLKLRLDLVDRAMEKLGQASELHERNARKEIMKIVNEILRETSRNNYRAALESDFSLIMKTPNGLEIGKSGGENQLISLAFISALIKFCKGRAAQDGENELLIPGTVAPLLLDAPFGQLDITYREATVKFLPQLAEQLVLFVTSSQGGDIVRELLREKIGAEYILIRENKKSEREVDQKQRPADMITIDGKTYRRAFYNQERDRTRVERIS